MPAKPRIAVVTPSYPNSAEPYLGIFNYRRALALANYADVEVFCALSTYPRWLRPNFRGYNRVDAAFTTPGMVAHYIHYPAVPMLSRPFNGWNCARNLLPALRDFRPDAILGYWIYPEGFGAVQAGRQLGVPVVVKTIGSDVRMIPDVVTRRLISRTLREASYVLAVSEDLRQITVQLGADANRTRTIRNGCDPNVFRRRLQRDARAELGVDPNAQLVLFVGRLAQVKGVGELLEASRLLSESHPALQVVCIGEGVLEEGLRGTAGDLERSGRVRFIGRKEPQEVARWLAASNMLCLPSYSEGCPNVVLEALFCGRPIVASYVGGIPELVDSGCSILVPPRDACKLASAIVEALGRSWDEAGIAAHYGRSWEDVGRETFEVFQEVLKIGTQKKI